MSGSPCHLARYYPAWQAAQRAKRWIVGCCDQKRRSEWYSTDERTSVMQATNIHLIRNNNKALFAGGKIVLCPPQCGKTKSEWDQNRQYANARVDEHDLICAINDQATKEGAHWNG